MSAVNEQLGSLTKMITELMTDYPNQPTEAIKEYLKNIEADKKVKKKELREKLTNDKKYLLKFQKAISYTSIFLYLTSRKAQLLCLPDLAENPSVTIDYEAYKKDFLDLSKDDDEFIKEMKLYHFESLNADEMFGELDESQYESKIEYEESLTKYNHIKTTYNQILQDFQKQYASTIL